MGAPLIGRIMRRARAKAFTFDRRILAWSLARRTYPRHDMIRLGSDYGGWWLPADIVDVTSTVYSVGVGEDLTFDEALVRRFGCVVYGFDPTPRAREYVDRVRPERFVLVPLALWIHEGVIRLYRQAEDAFVSLSVIDRDSTGRFLDVPCDTLTGFRRRLHHDRVDVLKIDIEGAEAAVLDWLISSSERPRVVMVECEKREPWWRTRRRVLAFMETGYVHVHCEAANHCFIRDTETLSVGGESP